MRKSIKPGKIIIPAGTLPETHELETANVLAAMGCDVEFLSPSYVKGAFSPDILMDGKIWEMKCPMGRNKRTLEDNYKKAEKQSENIIFDLRRIDMNEKIAIAKIKREFSARRGKAKLVLIIVKNEKILDLKR